MKDGTERIPSSKAIELKVMKFELNVVSIEERSRLNAIILLAIPFNFKAHFIFDPDSAHDSSL